METTQSPLFHLHLSQPSTPAAGRPNSGDHTEVSTLPCSTTSPSTSPLSSAHGETTERKKTQRRRTITHLFIRNVKSSMTTSQLLPSQTPVRRMSEATPSATSTQELPDATTTQSPTLTTTVISTGPLRRVSTSSPTMDTTSHPLRSLVSRDSLTSRELTISALRSALAARTITTTLSTRKTTPNSETSTQTSLASTSEDQTTQTMPTITMLRKKNPCPSTQPSITPGSPVTTTHGQS